MTIQAAMTEVGSFICLTIGVHPWFTLSDQQFLVLVSVVRALSCSERVSGLLWLRGSGL